MQLVLLKHVSLGLKIPRFFVDPYSKNIQIYMGFNSHLSPHSRDITFQKYRGKCELSPSRMTLQ